MRSSPRSRCPRPRRFRLPPLLLAALLSLLLLLAPGAAAAGGDLLLRNARLVDGTGGPVRSGISLLVRDGRIVRIAREIEAGEDLRVLDAEGATVVPGLIDAHVHLQVVPGSAQRGDSPERKRRLRREHLKAYLACGVTTVLDTGVRAEVARELRTWLGEGAPGPRYRNLGPMIVTPEGYLADWMPTVATGEELAAALERFEAVGSEGIKLFLERGFGPRELWPLPSPALREAVRRAAKRRELPLYVHGTDEEEQTLGLELGAHALVHTGFAASEPSAAFVERLAASGAYVISTLSHADSRLARWEPERLERPAVRRAVPAVVRATAADPEAYDALAARVLEMIVPELPGWLHRWLGPWILDEARLRELLRSAQAAAKRFHDAGVPLVVGSDAGNWPVDPYNFHGPTTLREMELLAEAGLGPAEVLAAATRRPARMLGLEDRVGTLEVGKRADLLVVEGDPLADIGALRRLRWTVRDGVARTPQEWMESEPSP